MKMYSSDDANELDARMSVLVGSKASEICAGEVARWPNGAGLIVESYGSRVRLRAIRHSEGEGYRGLDTQKRGGESLDDAILRLGDHAYRVGLSGRKPLEDFPEII